MKQQMLSEQKGKGAGRRLTQPSRGAPLVTESPTLDDSSDSPAARRRQRAALGTEIDEDWQHGESLMRSREGELEGGAPQLSSVQSLVTLQGLCGVGMTASQQSGGGDADQADDFSLFKHGLQPESQPNVLSKVDQGVPQQVFQRQQDCFNQSESNSSNDNHQGYQAIFADQRSQKSEEEESYGQRNNEEECIEKDQNQREEQRNIPSQFGTKGQDSQTKEQMSNQKLPKSQNGPQKVKAHSNLKTARMGVSDSREFTTEIEAQRISKSSTRQKRQAFSTNRNNNAVFANQKSLKKAQEANQVVQHADLMKSLQNKLRINLKKLQPSGAVSGGSSSYSNKDLSERFQHFIKQRSGVNPSKQTWIKNSSTPTETVDQSPNRQDSSLIGSAERTRQYQKIQLQQLLHQSQGMSPALSQIGVTSQNPQQLPPNLSQDPVLYLQWRQQKHKSSRSDYPHHQSNYLFQQRKASPANAHTLRGTKNKNQKNNGAQGGDLNSSFSNSSQTTAIKSLSEVKNPSHLISFRFVNRDATRLSELERFRNLTELDLFGNRLQSEVPELLKLPFLKKLNLANNKISEVWRLPPTLEILNLSYNSLKKLDQSVFRTLSNLTTLEVSNNGLESLDGLGQASRLKRFIAKNNQLQDLQPLKSLNMLVEVDLENNPIDQYEQLLALLEQKRELLVLNLKMTPILVKKQSYEQFMSELRLSDSPFQEKRADEFQQNLQFLYGGTFYRSRRVYQRIKQQMVQLNSKRSHSNFSNGSSSNENRTNLNSRIKGAFSPMHFSNSGNGQNRRADQTISDLSRSPMNEQESRLRGLSGSFNSNKHQNSKLLLNHSQQQYEAIELLYDKLLEDEDKLILIKKKKEKRVRREQRKQDVDYKPSFDESMSSEDDADLDDLSDTLNDTFDDDSLLSQNDDTFERDEFDLDELEANRLKNDENGSQNEIERELNASTADFNKEIKLINKQLQLEGKLPLESDGIQSPKVKTSVRKQQQTHQQQSVVQEVDESALISESLSSKKSITELQSSSNKDNQEIYRSFESQEQKDGGLNQIDNQEISVEVPREITSSRYTGRAHYKSARGNQNNPIKEAIQQNDGSVLRTDRILKTKKTSSTSFNKQEEQHNPENVSQNYQTENAKIEGSNRVLQAKLKLDLRKVDSNYQPHVVQKVSFGRMGGDSQRAGRIGPQGSSPATQIKTVQISERIPIKKSLGQKSPIQPSNQNETAMKPQLPPTVQQQQKNILIPKLALANINKQPSEVSQTSTFTTPVNLAKHQISEIGQNSKSGNDMLKTDEKANSKRVLRVLSKRGNNAQNDNYGSERQTVEQGQLIVPTIKPNQIDRGPFLSDQSKIVEELQNQISEVENILKTIKKELGEESMANSHINGFIQTLKQKSIENQKVFDMKLAQVNHAHNQQLTELQDKIVTLEEGKSCKVCAKRNIFTFLHAIQPPYSSFSLSVPIPNSLYFFLKLRQKRLKGKFGAQNIEQMSDLGQTRVSNFDCSLLSKINKLSEIGTPQGSNSKRQQSNSTRRGFKESPARHARRNSQTIQLSSKQEMSNLDSKQQTLISPSNFNESAYLMHTNAESRITEVLAKNNQIQRSRVRQSQAVSTETGPRMPRMLAFDQSLQEKSVDSSTQIKVVQLLEKMRERNSSLQERLNNSFKSNLRVEDQTVLTNQQQRPSTALNQSFKNKGIKTERAYMSQQQRNFNSKTPNMTVNLNSQKVQMPAKGEIRGGMRPQIVKIPANVLQNIVSAPSQEQKYMEFLDSSTALRNRNESPIESLRRQNRHIVRGDVVTLTSEDGDGSNRVRLEQGRVRGAGELTEESPLFNFHKASAILQNLSQTSRERVGSGSLVQNQATRSNDNFQVQNSYTNLCPTQTNNWVQSRAKPGTKTLKPSSNSIVQKSNAHLASNWKMSLQRSGSSEIISSALNSSAVVPKSNTFSQIKPPTMQQSLVNKPQQRTLGGHAGIGGSSTGKIPSQNNVSAYWTTGIGAIFNSQNSFQASGQLKYARNNSTGLQNKIELGLSASTGSLQARNHI